MFLIFKFWFLGKIEWTDCLTNKEQNGAIKRNFAREYCVTFSRD